MGFTLAQVEKIAERLKALPQQPAEKRALNKAEAVRRLAGEIQALQRKGYTLDEIAESLRSEGLALSTGTLKSYLQRTRRQTSKPKKRAAPAGGATPPKAPSLAPDGAPTNPPGSTAAASPEQPPKGSFLVRADSDDI